MIIPCDYFLKRGYKKETLNKFDVGLCVTKGSQAYMRATVPIYNDENTHMIGYLARSINNKCPICGNYHYYKFPCPRNTTELSFAHKWRNSAGFYSGATLYNIWNIKGKTVVVVEGPGDVWRLDEAGCKNSVGLFGVKLTKFHIAKLLEHKIENVVLCLDNDKAGEEATAKIAKRLELYFNIDEIKIKNKDVGETEIIEVQNLLKGHKWRLSE